MRRRACAAVLLCGPLVAGCGTAARLHFSGHARPATPVDISVYLAGGRPQVDPRQVRPGPVLFDLANQTARPARVALVLPDGRTAGGSVTIPAGGTAQLRAKLTRSAYGVEQNGRPASMTLVSTRGPARNGDNDLQQP